MIRIVDITVTTHRLTPVEAELWISVKTERTTLSMELRGRFVGPRCALSSTVEVAYPVRAFPQQPADRSELAGRVVIPEPSFWEPQCPFVYDGWIELWENGERCDIRKVPEYKLVLAGSTPANLP